MKKLSLWLVLSMVLSLSTAVIAQGDAAKKAKKLPFMRRFIERAARDAGCFTRGCERKTRRNRSDRCKRGAIGKELCGLGVGESSTILLNNLSYFNQWPR